MATLVTKFKEFFFKKYIEASNDVEIDASFLKVNDAGSVCILH